MPKIIIDTNVFISALINPAGIPAAILALVEAKKVELVLSPDILAEIDRVLKYPKILNLFQKKSINAEQLNDFRRTLPEMATLTAGLLIIDAIKDDPCDNIFLACAVEGKVDYIVSGDRHLTDLGEFRGIRIVSPVEFVQIVDK